MGRFIVATWADIMTPQSMREGEYAATGVHEFESSTDSLYEAADWLAEALEDFGSYEINFHGAGPDFAREVAYSSDPITDYSDGSQEYWAATVRAEPPMTDRECAVFNRLVFRAMKRRAA